MSRARLASFASVVLVMAGTVAVQTAAAPPASATAQNGYVFNDAWQLQSPGSAASQYSDGSFAQSAATKATTSIPLSSGAVNVTASFTAGPAQLPGTNVLTNGTNQAAYGATAATFTGAPDPARLPALGVVTTASSCDGGLGTAAHQNYEGVCHETGELTLTFSKAVTDPILDISGIGGLAMNAETNSAGTDDYGRGSFDNTHWTITSPGATFANPSAGRTNLAVGGTTLNVVDNNTSAFCDHPQPDGAGEVPIALRKLPVQDLAGCGSATLKGTFTSVTFRLDTEVSPFSKHQGGGTLFTKNDGTQYADGTNGLNVVNTEKALLPRGDTALYTGDLHRISLRLPEVNSLGDYVWKDTNADGVQDAGEPGVAGVKAELLDCTGQPVDGKVTTTDADGKYLFDGLKDGCYEVKFTAPDGSTFTKQHAGDTAKDSDANPATGTTQQVTLGPDHRQDLTIDAGLIEKPSNSLGDFVWQDTNRNGIQDAGEPPVPGVPVTLLDCQGQPVDGNGDGTPDAATTDTDGKYLFDGLKDGCYEVEFVAPAGKQLTVQHAGGDPAKDSDANPATGITQQVTLGPDHRQDLTIDAGLVNPTYELGDFVWQDTNRDGIQDAGEPGVANVPVSLLDCSGNSTPLATTTGADGKYRFAGLEAGCYRVKFTAENFTKQSAGTDRAKDSNADIATGVSGDVVLGPDNPKDETIDAGLVTPLNRLGDFVWQDTNGNGIQDDGEPGVPNVPVSLLDCSGNGTPLATTTGADGKYLFDSLEDGCYQVKFTAPDGTKFTQQHAGTDSAADSDANPATGITQQVTLGANHREDLTIDAGLVLPNPVTYSLGDTVWSDTDGNGLQDAGEPGVPNVPVSLLDCSGNPVKGPDGKPLTTSTDADGHYRFAGLGEGCYQVEFAAPDGKEFTVQHAGDPGKDSDANPATGISQPVMLGPDNAADLTVDAGLVSPTNSLGDLVWADTDGNGVQDAGESGVAGVTVRLLDCSGKALGPVVKTDAEGGYRFTGLADGGYRVKFDKSTADGDFANWTFTARRAGGDAAKDSDAASDGTTSCVRLGKGNRNDLTVDAGLKQPAGPGAPSGNGDNGDPGDLAFTGVQLGSILGLALLLLGGGGAALLITRRRKTRGER
ncbi:SdrD B-like domain-containing protein [Amycolatopsis sp. WGS_07]|uniref:SdrD B-like domain-containing protein n=1 Tax=Amycolatopsis sp. WGS_07 TaxID=3076764 RepID=UPI0038730B34